MLRKADTIEALAADCGIDATTLRATVDRYNAQVQRGVDDDFQRGENSFDEWSGDPLKADAKTLGAIEQRSEEHTSELQSLMRISYAVFCLKTNTTRHSTQRL